VPFEKYTSPVLPYMYISVEGLYAAWRETVGRRDNRRRSMYFQIEERRIEKSYLLLSISIVCLQVSCISEETPLHELASRVAIASLRRI
jgi:hypothetical protein